MIAAHVVILLALIGMGSPSDTPSAESIVQQSQSANEIDWKANPEYDWTERDLQPNGSYKTFQEFMILGSPYGKLIAINNAPLSADKAREEQQKLEAEINKRKSETPDQRQRRIADFDKERSREHAMMSQLTQAFDFKLIGEKRYGSHEVYLLHATPKRGYHPPSMECQALTGMQGRLWIDKKTFQWVRVEAEVVHPVSIEGILARVEPGTRFELEKTPVKGGVWLPKHYSMRSNARVLFMVSRKGRDDETYWNYSKSKNY
jgi:hypothetical protein